MQPARKLGIENLYHYRPFNAEHLIQTVVFGIIRFSNPADFNDPWDCRPRFGKDILKDAAAYERHVQYLADLSRRHTPPLTEPEINRRSDELRGNRAKMEWIIDEHTTTIAKAIREKYRIFCLSTKADCPLMWGHYAAAHSGICLEFATTNEVFGDAYKVGYSAEYPEVDLTSHDEGELVTASLLTKAECWRYEDEFRMVAREGVSEGFLVTQDGFHQYDRPMLRAVIVGCQMGTRQRETVRWIVANSGGGAVVKRAAMRQGRYELSIEPA